MSEGSPGGLGSFLLYGNNLDNFTFTIQYGTPSAEAQGLAHIALATAIILAPHGNGSDASEGVAHMANTGFTVAPKGVASAEAQGRASIARATGIALAVRGVSSAEAQGRASIAKATGIILAVKGVPSAESQGKAGIANAVTLSLSPRGVPSSEAQGITRVASQGITLAVRGTPSAENTALAHLSSGGQPFTVLYYQQSGEEEPYTHWDEEIAEKLSQLTWELGGDEYEKGKPIGLKAFTMNAYRDSDVTGEGERIMTQAFIVIDERAELRRKWTIVGVTGAAMWFTWRFLL